MRVPAALLLCLGAAGCGAEPSDYGPPPPSDHQAKVCAAMDRVFAGNYELAGPSGYRFAEPVPDRVSRWHFEFEVEGQNRSFGNVYGWRVDFWVQPRYAGFPEQPESRRMAFFADGALRGLFLPGGDNAPLELDRWSPAWVDVGWLPVATPAK